jgi:hypothetical protein
MCVLSPETLPEDKYASENCWDDSVGEFAEKKVLKLGSGVTKIVNDDAAVHILKNIADILEDLQNSVFSNVSHYMHSDYWN